jgi:quinol monooxygenase YgiN
MKRDSLEAEAVTELMGIARFKFHEGKVEEFKRLSAQAKEVVRAKETGTLQYDIYFNDDQSECIVIERYRDSEALTEHLAHLGDLSGAILATGSVSGELLGEPSAELRANLADAPVRLFTPYLSL